MEYCIVIAILEWSEIIMTDKDKLKYMFRFDGDISSFVEYDWLVDITCRVLDRPSTRRVYFREHHELTFKEIAELMLTNL